MISLRLFTVLATVVALVLGQVRSCYPEAAGVKLPEITFSADRDTITEGECTTLHWEVTGLREGDTVHVDREQVKPSGQKKVCPTKSRRYELELRTDVGWFEGDFLDIEVVPPEPTPEPECTKDKQCCDLHEGEVWKCDEDGNCVKVGCNEDVDCKICPGEWKCEPPFGDCVKATPTPEPQCTDDADCDPDADEECVDGDCVAPQPECTVNQDCEEGWECSGGQCQEAEPTPTPMPEEEQVLPVILGEVCGFVGEENRLTDQEVYLGVLVGDDLSEEYCSLPPEERDHKLHGEDWNFIAVVPVGDDHTYCFTDVPPGVKVRVFTNMVVGDDGRLVSINAGPLINTEGGGFFDGGNAAKDVVSCH